MPTVIVKVNDRPYNIVCDEGEEPHLTELAGLIADEVDKLKKSFGQVGDSRLLLMAGLVVADKLDETVKRIEALEGRNREPQRCPHRCCRTHPGAGNHRGAATDQHGGTVGTPDRRTDRRLGIRSD